MSEVRVNNIVDYGGKGAPTFDNGAVISGVSSLGSQAKIGSNVTITSGGINVSGVTTAATLSGNLTGDVNSGFVTATSAVIGSGVTINAGGLNITGVMTATTFEGDGSSMTGVAMTIAPLAYNPDVNDSIVTLGTGIGITFDHRILAGSGNITLSVATNAGAAGTVVENFGVGSSVTIAGRNVSFTPTSELDSSETYHISYPSGAFTNTSGDVSYVGTAYTFGCRTRVTQLWGWGASLNGSLGQNQGGSSYISSPVQIPGTTWSATEFRAGHYNSAAIKTDGTLWTWGHNAEGELGHNNRVYYSSPVQVPGTWSMVDLGFEHSLGLKTDGTLWAWGKGNNGRSGLNIVTSVSSPTQIPGTTWDSVHSEGYGGVAVKTNGTLWVWGSNSMGQLGQNNNTYRSSPVQVPGTTWSSAAGSLASAFYAIYAIKTDGTLWGMGRGSIGGLGQNNATNYSSPVQIPGTWSKVRGGYYGWVIATKTDGTLWTFGQNNHGQIGDNSVVDRSSPIQIPGAWNDVGAGFHAAAAIKTDGTLWSWGYGNPGQLGQNDRTDNSSPVQIPGTDWHRVDGPLSNGGIFLATKQI